MTSLLKTWQAAALLLLSWLLFQAVHEFGHVLAAWGTGATVERVVLHPLTISRTDIADAAHPLAVTWGGPIFGAFFPLGLFFLLPRNMPGRHFFRFFAGFCLVANGVYIGADFSSTTGFTDTARLITHGAARWQTVLFGLISVTLGFYLWHRQSKNFGFGPEAKPVSPAAVCILTVLLTAVIAAECLFFAAL